MGAQVGLLSNCLNALSWQEIMRKHQGPAPLAKSGRESLLPLLTLIWAETLPFITIPDGCLLLKGRRGKCNEEVESLERPYAPLAVLPFGRRQSLEGVVENVMMTKEKVKEKLRASGTPGSWDHITEQKGGPTAILDSTVST